MLALGRLRLIDPKMGPIRNERLAAVGVVVAPWRSPASVLGGGGCLGGIGFGRDAVMRGEDVIGVSIPRLSGCRPQRLREVGSPFFHWHPAG